MKVKLVGIDENMHAELCKLFHKCISIAILFVGQWRMLFVVFATNVCQFSFLQNYLIYHTTTIFCHMYMYWLVFIRPKEEYQSKVFVYLGHSKNVNSLFH